MGITAVGLPQRATEGELENGKVDGENKSACRAPDAGSVKFCTEDRLSGFDCNICLSTAETPIVTLCGHLFCWHCIHLWSGNKHGGAQVSSVQGWPGPPKGDSDLRAERKERKEPCPDGSRSSPTNSRLAV